MDRIYKMLSVWMVLAMVFLGMVPAASAQEPEGSLDLGAQGMGREFVPPRPDLDVVLSQDGVERPGLSLSASMSPEEAARAFQEYLAQKLDSKASIPGVTRITQPARPGGSKLAAQANAKRVVVALVEFSDLAHNQIPQPADDNNTDYWINDFSPTHYENMLFADRPQNRWSMRSYFQDASYDTYDMIGHVFGWKTLTQTAAYYGADPTGGLDQNLAQFVQDAADAIAGDLNTLVTGPPAVPWSDFGDDVVGGRNVIDYFIIVHAGKGQESGGGALGDDALWSTAGTLSPEHPIAAPATGAAIRNFVVVAEDSPIGVFVHEMGHLFGLPDTWNYRLGVRPDGQFDDMDWPEQDYDYDNAFPGGRDLGEASPSFYDPMAEGCWLGNPPGTMPASLTAWERIELGWLTPAEWTLCDPPTTLKLEQINEQTGNRAIRINLPTQTLVTPHSGSCMQRAPDPSDMTSPSILTHTLGFTATTSAIFRWWQWYDLEPNADFGYVEVGVGSPIAWTRVYTFTGSSYGWEQRSIDLSSYIPNVNVVVRFVLERDTFGEGLGWFLDDFELWEDGNLTWSDDSETSDPGPGQWTPTLGFFWERQRFPRTCEDVTSDAYYLLEWRNDDEDAEDSGFDRGLGDAYNMTPAGTRKAEYFSYNPGLLVWYINPAYGEGDNDVTTHPGEGFLLAIDSHPDVLWQSNAEPFRTRVQMQDATFREAGKATYQNLIHDPLGAPFPIGPFPAVDTFWDGAGNPYWRADAPYNSAKTPVNGVQVEVYDEEYLKQGAWIRLTNSVDVEISKEVAEEIAEPGDTLHYTIVVTNVGLSDACQVTISDTAPAYASLNPGSVVVDPPGGSLYADSDSFRWQGTVYLTSPVTITFEMLLDSVILSGTQVVNTGRAYHGSDLKDEDIAITTIHSEPCLAYSQKYVDYEPRTPQGGVLPGDFLTYTIALSNTGNMTATAILTDCIPACTTLVSGPIVDPVTNTISLDWDGDCFTWRGTVPVDMNNPTVWITFTVQVDPVSPYCSQIVNEALIFDEGTCDEIQLQAAVVVGEGPNLRLSDKQITNVDPLMQVAPGDRLDYEIGLFNAGNESGDIEVEDFIPDNTTYISGTLACTAGSCPEDPSRIYWAEEMAPGERVTLTFSVSVTTPLTNGTIITNVATITETKTGAGGWTQVYTRLVTRTVRSEPWFELSTKQDQYDGTPVAVAYGDVLTYTIVLFNNGTEAANPVFLTDTIPEGTKHDPAVHVLTATMPTVSFDSGIGDRGAVLWNGGPIAPGDKVTITFEVTITADISATIVNVAEINDGWPDHGNWLITETTRIAALQVGTAEVYCGDPICVPIWAYNVEDMVGAQVTVEFITDVIRLAYVPVPVKPGDLFAPVVTPYFTPQDITSTNVITVDVSLNAVEGKDGDVDVFWLCFRAVGPGYSPITITASTLLATRDPSDPLWPSFKEIPHNTVNGGITVQGRVVTGTVWLQGRIPDDADGVSVLLDGEKQTESVDGYYSFCPPVPLDPNDRDMLLRLEKDGYLYAEGFVTIPMTDNLQVDHVTLLGGDVIGLSSYVTIPVTTTAGYTCTDPITTAFKTPDPPEGEVRILDLTFVGSRLLKYLEPGYWYPLNMGVPYPEPDECYPFDWYVDPADGKTKAVNHFRADITEDGVIDITDLVLVGLNFGAKAWLSYPLWP